MQFRAVLLVLAAATIWPAHRVEASCVYMGPLCQTWKNNAAIFDGTVRSIERVDRDEDMGGRTARIGHRLVTFDVHESWLGDVGPRVQLLLWGGSWAGMSWMRSNDFRVEIGKRYVIFAHRNEQGELSASSCSGSREYEQASAELAFLKSLKGPPPGARLLGDVALFLPRLTSDFSTRQPVEATVRVTGTGYDRSLSVKDYKYELAALKPGPYTIAISGPRGLIPDPESVSVFLEDGYSCRAVPFSFRHDASIAGLLTDPAGKPLKTQQVELALAETWKRHPTRVEHTYTDDDGLFEFAGVPPGEFVVGLNLRDQVGYAAYPRTMYPDDSADPHMIRVATGQHVWLGAWQVGHPLPEVKMRVRIVSPDGQPFRRVGVSLLDVTTPGLQDDRRRVRGGITDDDGWVVSKAERRAATPSSSSPVTPRSGCLAPDGLGPKLRGRDSC